MEKNLVSNVRAHLEKCFCEEFGEITEENRDQLEIYLETHSNFRFFQEELDKAQDAFRKACPTLALVYELQDEMIYNQILTPQKTLILGNEEEKNKEILTEMFKEFEAEYEHSSEREEFDLKIYPKLKKYLGFDISDNEDVSRKKAYAVYKMQQLTNKDVDEYRKEHEEVNERDSEEKSVETTHEEVSELDSGEKGEKWANPSNCLSATKGVPAVEQQAAQEAIFKEAQRDQVHQQEQYKGDEGR